MNFVLQKNCNWTIHKECYCLYGIWLESNYIFVYFISTHKFFTQIFGILIRAHVSVVVIVCRNLGFFWFSVSLFAEQAEYVLYFSDEIRIFNCIGKDLYFVLLAHDLQHCFNLQSIKINDQILLQDISIRMFYFHLIIVYIHILKNVRKNVRAE